MFPNIAMEQQAALRLYSAHLEGALVCCCSDAETCNSHVINNLVFKATMVMPEAAEPTWVDVSGCSLRVCPA